jgi:hypothetical protein
MPIQIQSLTRMMVLKHPFASFDLTQANMFELMSQNRHKKLSDRS